MVQLGIRAQRDRLVQHPLDLLQDPALLGLEGPGHVRIDTQLDTMPVKVAFDLAQLGKNLEVIARARCDIEAMRLIVLKAAKAMDLLGNREARVWVSMAKAMVQCKKPVWPVSSPTLAAQYMVTTKKMDRPLAISTQSCLVLSSIVPRLRMSEAAS